MVGLQVARSLGSAGANLTLNLPQRASAGGSIDNGVYWACITSYDYDAPISEAGDYGQPGIGGPNKFDVRCPQ